MKITAIEEKGLHVVSILGSLMTKNEQNADTLGFVISYHAWKLQEVWQKLRTAAQEKAVQGFCTAFFVG